MQITEHTIIVETEWSTPVYYSLAKRKDKSNQLAVLFPGANYPCKAPLLDFTAQVALQKGFDVLMLEYGFQTNRSTEVNDKVGSSLNEMMPVLESYVADYQQTVFVSKSIGTVIAGDVSSRLGTIDTQVFLTPVRTTIAYICAARRSLVIVGDRDNLFTKEDIQRISGKHNTAVHVVPNADHALRVAGDYSASLSILSNVADWCSDFFDSMLCAE